jgi:predicted AAA+ superfamily ATPase
LIKINRYNGEVQVKAGIIITEDKEGEENHGNKKIVYIPLWKWLLD